ncbi:MAG: HNH endonuclease [Actinomycetota bacterium]|nr:HNH endonuclease [Actinomycetota bacterium]
MFDAATDPEFAEWLADVPEPDWLEHPVYAAMLSDAERLRDLLAVPPAVRRTGELARLDPRVLSAGEQVDLLAGLEEQKNWIESVQARVLAEIDNADSTKQGLGQEVVSLVLKVPLRTAQARLKAARSLVRELPTTLRLLEQGVISGKHAEVIAEASWRLDPDLVGQFETRVCARADSQTVPQLKQSIRRAELAIDPVTGEQRHQRALADRKVGFQPADDGMVQLPVLVGAVEGQLIYTRLTAAATLLPAHDPRSMDQKRADLLVDAVLSGLPQDALPDMQGRKPSIQVVVSADTLLCLDDQPGHLTGYGPITAETARRLAADQSGTWRRLLTDPDTGQLLDISQDHYRPSQRLRDFVNARDDVCCFPTCHQPGYRCHYEHITPYLQGGQTCRCNGALACRRHNNCKIDSDWDYTRNPDGSFTWTDDTEHGYTSYPPERWTQPGDEPPPPPKQVTLKEVHTTEDTAYAALEKRWQQELHQATENSDQARITNAEQAITAAGNQRARQLAHRADSTNPPF